MVKFTSTVLLAAVQLGVFIVKSTALLPVNFKRSTFDLIYLVNSAQQARCTMHKGSYVVWSL